MGIFGGSEKPRLTPHKFKEFRRISSTQGVSSEHRDELENILAADLDERTGELRRTDGEGEARSFSGVDRDNLEKKFEWMQKNPNEHNIPLDKLDELKSKLDKHL